MYHICHKFMVLLECPLQINVDLGSWASVLKPNWFMVMLYKVKRKILKFFQLEYVHALTNINSDKYYFILHELHWLP